MGDYDMNHSAFNDQPNIVACDYTDDGVLEYAKHNTKGDKLRHQSTVVGDDSANRK
jgi:hypothetical protein